MGKGGIPALRDYFYCVSHDRGIFSFCILALKPIILVVIEFLSHDVGIVKRDRISQNPRQAGLDLFDARTASP